MAYGRQFSHNIGHMFTDESIRVTALTGSAATKINGETTTREFQLHKHKNHATQEDVNAFSDTRQCCG